MKRLQSPAPLSKVENRFNVKEEEALVGIEEKPEPERVVVSAKEEVHLEYENLSEGKENIKANIFEVSTDSALEDFEELPDLTEYSFTEEREFLLQASTAQIGKIDKYIYNKKLSILSVEDPEITNKQYYKLNELDIKSIQEIYNIISNLESTEVMANTLNKRPNIKTLLLDKVIYDLSSVVLSKDSTRALLWYLLLILLYLLTMPYSSLDVSTKFLLTNVCLVKTLLVS